MSMNVYNIVWADDEIDDLYEAYKRRFEDHGLRVIGKAHDGKELDAIISELKYQIDAVIIDANFNWKEIVTNNERDVTGLDYAHNIYVHKFERTIPFFLFTNRSDEMLREELKNKPQFFEDFPRYKRWFKKSAEGEWKDMVDAIKIEVDHRNSDSFRIRNKYSREFEAARLIEDATENLERGLLYLYEDTSWKDTQDYFNPARKIVERIIDSCVNMKLLPPHISLNTAQRILSGTINDFTLTTSLMEKPLAESLKYFLSITQDGSHDANDLQLGIDQYVRKTRNVNLYMSILHIAMDLLLWHKEMKEKYGDNENRIWNATFEFMGKVRMHPKWNNVFYTGKYQLENKNGTLKDGDMVGIRKSDTNRNPGLKPNITDYVFENNYIIL